MNFNLIPIVVKTFLKKKVVLLSFFTLGWLGGLGGIAFGMWQLAEAAYSEVSIPSPPPEKAVLGQAIVEVAGAVQKPGLYTINFGSRWGHVLEQAGGLHPQADLQYVQTQVSLADQPRDGAKLYVPFLDEEPVISAGNQATTQATTQLSINLNTASASELDTLPGVGQKTVEAILAARPFTTSNELLSKKIVGEKTYKELEKLVTTN